MKNQQNSVQQEQKNDYQNNEGINSATTPLGLRRYNDYQNDEGVNSATTPLGFRRYNDYQNDEGVNSATTPLGFRRYFAAATTPLGFRSFFSTLINAYNLKKLYILKGGSGVGKSTLMSKLAAAFPSERIDYIHCSNDPDSLDGVILVDKKVGMIDGTNPHILDPTYPGVIDEIVNLGEFIIKDKVKATKEKIDEINAIKKMHNEAAVQSLQKAREAHMELEALYKGAVNFEDMNALLEKIISENSQN